MKAKLILSMFVLALVSSSFGVVIGNFENGSYDGWVAAGATVLSLGTEGHTLDADALQLQVAGGYLNAASVNVMDKIPYLTAAGAKITMDVSNSNVDALNIPDWWMGLYLVINTDAGWFQQGGEQQFPVTWDLSTNTLEWTLDAASQAGLALPNKTYAEIFIGSNTGASGAKFFIDNVQIVPEPATMVLMGLGGLSLIRRKR
jgi:hypothetical protein